jgi:uncharacterized Zn finger protein (UPF0148 family)
MNGHWHCEECGPIPAMKRTPENCPICGHKIEFVTNEEKKLFPTSDERAAEWFKKMREATEVKTP